MGQGTPDRTEPAAKGAPRERTATRVERLPDGEFLVIHPLDDTAEDKLETEDLGYTPMTPMVRWSLIALRTYLIMMAAMVFYRCLQLAGFVG